MQVDLNRYIDEHREDIIRAVQEIVRIPSVEAEALPGKPFGERQTRPCAFRWTWLKDWALR